MYPTTTRGRNDMTAGRPVGLFCLALIASLLYAGPSWAETFKVSLLLGDSHSKAALEAVKAVNKTLASRRDSSGAGKEPEEVVIRTYSQKGMQKSDLAYLRESRLVIIFTMDYQLVDAVKPELEQVIKEGGKVYAVGESYNESQRAMGILYDGEMDAYFKTAIRENIENMILFALNRHFSLHLPVGAPVSLPESGFYEPHGRATYEDFDAFRAAYPAREGSGDGPWIGIYFNRISLETGETKTLEALTTALEERGFNVLPVFGFPTESVLERYFLSPAVPRVRSIVALGAKLAVNPAVVVPLLEKIGAPVIDAISLYKQSEEEWRSSPSGLDIFERTWQVGNPEMAGIIQPTVIASKEKGIDEETGIDYVEEKPISERIGRLCDRVKAWVNLQEKPNGEKRVALIYYNYPPGKQTIGASYLNVLPGSLWEILQRLKGEGYSVEKNGPERVSGEVTKEALFREVGDYGRNIGNWAPGEIDRLVKSGRPVLLPLSVYEGWFAGLPEGLRQSILKRWGPVEKSNIMIWKDGRGNRFIVIPALQYGNVVLAPQPSRGWEQDPEKMYHDVTAPPHHQYIAFYLWLKHSFQADAMAHIGTHGTHEWLSGKEVGFTDEDPSEALLQDTPQIYPYLVDDVGEGLQAKRRGMAVIIDHMTPPFDRAGLNKESRELLALINDYEAAQNKSASLAESKGAEILARARKAGIMKDLGLKAEGGVLKDEDVDAIEHHLRETAELQTPFGLHTFGRAPEEKYRKSTAEAILSIEKNLTPEERQERLADLEERIVQSGRRELDSFVAALDGRYIPAGQGNDPIRNPDSLPTGRNFYAFDASRIPSKTIYETGAALAEKLVETYRAKHGVLPDKLAITLWAVETITNEGVMESQILRLLGVIPKWDERGRVTGVEVLPRATLGRPRIDVTILTSGLYRDVFPNLMDLLDKAVGKAKEAGEEDNILRANTAKTKATLLARGVDPELAERLATVRIFGEPSGAYGNGIVPVITKSDSWKGEKEVAEVFFRKTGYLFGQGFWGERTIAANHEAGKGSEADLGLLLFKNALSGTKIAVLGRSSNLFGTLDNDDVFQYLGGLTMAVRAVDGKSPEVYVTNLAGPKEPKQESIEKYMGREMRSRYLNPEWIKAMMKDGYAGAKFIDSVTENLWGWQVTVPEAVDGAKWNEMYETYVLDKNNLGVKEMFRKAGNLFAYQALVARMLETTRKEYWKPDRQVVETLAKEYALTAIEIGLACCDHTCNNPALTAHTTGVLLSVPGLRSLAQRFADAQAFMKGEKSQKATPRTVGSGTKAMRTGAPGASRVGKGGKTGNASQSVSGYVMEETNVSGPASSAPIPYLFLIGFLICIGLVGLGFRRRERGRRRV